MGQRGAARATDTSQLDADEGTWQVTADVSVDKAVRPLEKAVHALAPLPADDRVTCVPTEPLRGEYVAGDVLLDGKSIGRVSRHIRPAYAVAHLALGLDGLDRIPAEEDLIWHVEASGWVPRSDRPWDRRITRTAPTRRRAIEDLLRAYGNRR